MRQSDLVREVEAVIEERLAENAMAPVEWIIHTVLNRHRAALGAISGDEDRDFFELCGREHVHATVRAALRNRDHTPDVTEPDQQELPGLKHMKRSYTITRGGEQVVVRLEQMTSSEIRGKVQVLRAFAVGAMGHVRELEEYLAAREAGAIEHGGEAGQHPPAGA